MPEHIRALIVVLLIASIVFAFAQRPACEIIPYQDYKRRRNLWFGITLVAFLAHNYWLYVMSTGFFLLFTSRRETNVVALFFSLLFILPVAYVKIPAFGLVNFLFSLSHQRLLCLAVLLPAALILAGRKNTLPFGKLTADKLLFAYILLTIALYLRETSITNTLRNCLYQFTDVFLPYYVISRSLKNMADFRSALLAFMIAAMILAAIAVFEASRHWLLYQSLISVLDMGKGMTGYLGREGVLRAVASAGHSIALGYLIAIAIGFYLFLRQSISSPFARRMGLLLLLAGLFAPVSRGPWIGALFVWVVFLATGKQAVKHLSILFFAGLFALPIMAVMPGGEKIINLIPFVGKTEAANIDYRARLFETSLIVIKRNPWFGSVDYLETPEMESMRQGRGLIDIVNTYVGVALESGFVGVGLFIGFFLAICWGIYQGFRKLPDKNSEEHLLGRTLLATLAGILLIIATVSSISIIPIVYWSVAGLGVAYINLLNNLKAQKDIVV
jgi:hypothetical protein